MTNVSQGLGGNHFDPRIAVDSSNNVHVAWYDPDGWGYYRKRTPAGAWVDWFSIDAPGSIENEEPRLVVDSACHPHLIWLLLTADWCVYYGIYDGADWTIERVSANIDGDVIDDGYEIAVDSNRKAHVAYSAHDVGEKADVFYATNAAGAFARTNITDNRQEEDYGTALGLDSAGKARIAWINESPLWNLHYSTNSPGAFSSPIQISVSSETISKMDPHLKVDSSDAVHVVWSERYSVEGPPTVGADITFTYEAWYTNNCAGSFAGAEGRISGEGSSTATSLRWVSIRRTPFT